MKTGYVVCYYTGNEICEYGDHLAKWGCGSGIFVNRSDAETVLAAENLKSTFMHNRILEIQYDPDDNPQLPD